MSKPGKSLKGLCKKLGVRLTVKRGQKRVYKSVAVLKRQCKNKVKKKKKKVKRKRRFGTKRQLENSSQSSSKKIKRASLVSEEPEIPKHLQCPITLSLMKDPVTASDGQTYEKEAIEKWMKNNNNSSPFTRKPITSINPNFAIKNLCEQFILSNETLLTKELMEKNRNTTIKNSINDFNRVKNELHVNMISNNNKPINLRGANLRGANLRRANLRGANLYGAELERANLEYADLQDAILQGADLGGADLQYARLQGANLRGANLVTADLQDAKLPGADLQGANLYWADLDMANLKGANLRSADLIRTNLEEAYLEGAYYNDDTLFPGDFIPEQKGMILDNSNSFGKRRKTKKVKRKRKKKRKVKKKKKSKK